MAAVFPCGGQTSLKGEAMEPVFYRDALAEAGIDTALRDRRVEECFHEIFYGPDRVYFGSGRDTAYILDTGNLDVRTEGMSYGMMICVQLDKKEEFDRLWRWALRHMYMTEGKNSGYFAWSVSPKGVPNARGPAPDGEEYFAMALFFASHRWGDGEGELNYSIWARTILRTCLHKEDSGPGRNMWDRENGLIRFIPEADFTDPSYHLPHFYELFALLADHKDRPFWKKAAEASRAYLQRACHPVTGLSAEYAEFDGSPLTRLQERFGRHDWHYSDAYRTAANIAMDYSWFGELRGETWQTEITERIRKFFLETVAEDPRGIYTVDGTALPGAALHPVAITATLAESALCAPRPLEGAALRCVRDFWDTPLRRGDRRYYDNCLYMFALLALGGKYRIW